MDKAKLQRDWDAATAYGKRLLIAQIFQDFLGQTPAEEMKGVFSLMLHHLDKVAEGEVVGDDAPFMV